MTKWILALTLTFNLVPSLFAVEKTKVDYLCQQDDGDIWIEAAVIPEPVVGYRLLVIKHDYDAGDTVIYNQLGFAVDKSDYFISFEDEKNSTLMIGTETNKGILVLNNENEIFKLGGLYCYTNKEIELP